MSECFGEDLQGLRVLKAPARNNYFYGKLLDVQHFQLEQRYFNTRRWLLNRMVLGSGVLCGLGLVVTRDGKLILHPGVAITPQGVEITVPQAVEIDPRHITDDCGRPLRNLTTGTVSICLAYHPCPTEMVPVLVADCDTREGCAPSTIVESFAVVVHQGAPHIYEPACAIQDLFKPGPGHTRGRVDEVYARIVELMSRDCADPGPETCVMLGQVTLRANAPLTQHDVRPIGRRVVLNNTLLFELLLCLWDRVEQCCAAPPSTPAPTVAPTVRPTISPTLGPTVGPTVAPTVPPTVAPTSPPTLPPTIPPTIAPPTLLRVGSVRFIHQSTGPNDPEVEVAVMRDPRQPVPVPARGRANALEVGFTADARVEPRSLQDQVTVLVAGPGGRIPGRIALVSGANAFRWTPVELQEFKGEFKVGLIGDGTNTIVSTVGRRLDGEPRGLPSGDGNEGGNFEFAFVVS